MYYQFDPTLGLVLIVAGGVAVLTLLAGAVWVALRSRNLTHAERMRALELGVLPEVLQAGTEQSRLRASGTIGVLVPVAAVAAAAVGTQIMLSWRTYEDSSTVLYVVWGVCGLTAFITATSALTALQRRGKAAHASEKAATRRVVDTREAIKEIPLESKEKYS
jgi:hypothetical protein